MPAMSKTEVFRKLMHPRRLMRGAAVSVDDSGVSREAFLAALRRTELLCNMPEALAGGLLEAMAGRRVREGAVLFREGARGDSLLLKASGTARVSQLRPGLQETRVLAVLTEPAVLGQESFYGVEKRSITVRMLTAGTVFHLRRGVFAELVAQTCVTWCDAERATAQGAHLLWIGDAGTRPRTMPGVPCITIDHIKRYVREAPAGAATLCCARDDTAAAFAAFLLSQRGLRAVAVRQGRKLSVSEPDRSRESIV